LNAQFSNEFDEYAFNYLKSLENPIRNLINKDNEYFIEAKTNIIKELINLYFSDSQYLNIVDVGTGIGLFEKFLQGSNIKIFGIDLSYQMLQVAKNINTIKGGGYCQANAFHLPLPDNSADIVFTSCVIHHIPDEKRELVIKDMYRVCKPGGMIVIFEHNPLNLLTQFVVNTTPLDKNTRLVSSKKLYSLIRNMGVKKCTVNYFLYGSREIDKLINSFMKIIGKTPLGGQYFILAAK
jgi:ubiquinone/menaquinone biosynthesis C-methylase UbiE